MHRTDNFYRRSTQVWKIFVFIRLYPMIICKRFNFCLEQYFSGSCENNNYLYSILKLLVWKASIYSILKLLVWKASMCGISDGLGFCTSPSEVFVLKWCLFCWDAWRDFFRSSYMITYCYTQCHSCVEGSFNQIMFQLKSLLWCKIVLNVKICFTMLLSFFAGAWCNFFEVNVTNSCSIVLQTHWIIGCIFRTTCNFHWVGRFAS